MKVGAELVTKTFRFVCESEILANSEGASGICEADALEGGTSCATALSDTTTEKTNAILNAEACMGIAPQALGLAITWRTWPGRLPRSMLAKSNPFAEVALRSSSELRGSKCLNPSRSTCFRLFRNHGPYSPNVRSTSETASYCIGKRLSCAERLIIMGGVVIWQFMAWR